MTPQAHKTEEYSYPEFFTDDFIKNPYPTYAHLRENEPVFHTTYPGEPVEIYVLSRYDDVKEAFSHPCISKQRKHVTQGLLAPNAMHRKLKGFHTNLVMVDPPVHTRMRKVVTRELNPARINALKERAQEYIDELIDAMAPRGEADLIGDFANPLPTKVLGEWMLGIPPSKEWDEFLEKSTLLVTPRYDYRAEDYDALKLTMNEFILDLLEHKRANPADDLLTAFVTAHANGEIDDDEVIGITVTMLLAGFASTTFLIGNAALALLTHPDQMKLLQERPELLDSAVEEFIRYDGSMQTATFRFTSEDLEIQGTTIPRGSIIVLALASAHRDPDAFERPDEFDITRGHNPHMGFGLGVHSCPGNRLGRLFTKMAIGSLVQRIPDLTLAVDPDELKWRPGLLHRGLFELPVRFTPQPGPATGAVSEEVTP
ncbi:cytochrome P450 family protein [Carbonactinospora thermoautotrophica]|uniref:cytochrome P450 family protein n=1 Tax=Carbonactinospora thermoautotrophica TaxID=1469144 RepID=UPI000835AB40|nr:cytochrome P450 [Carbonactinospora thermoautotrophica]